jgi:urea transporter
MTDLLLRFLIGGTVVSLFAILGDIFRPKSFAGLFGAAPSIALATLGLTIHHDGKLYAAIEARSMIAGAIAMAAYAATVSWILLRYKPPALTTTLVLLPVWFGVSFGIWHLCFR